MKPRTIHLLSEVRNALMDLPDVQLCTVLEAWALGREDNLSEQGFELEDKEREQLSLLGCRFQAQKLDGEGGQIFDTWTNFKAWSEAEAEKEQYDSESYEFGYHLVFPSADQLRVHLNALSAKQF